MIKHKYFAESTTTHGIRFPSKKEAGYHDELLLRVMAGEVIFFLRQVPFHLPGNTKYIVDFQEFHADGTVHFIDVKGYETAEFKLKKRLVESLYPVEIEIV